MGSPTCADVIVAYEPVWAIGTVRMPHPTRLRRSTLLSGALSADMYGDRVAETTRILYGGSVTPENIG